MKRAILALILLLALGGALAAGYLTRQHFRLQAGATDKPSFCSFNQTFDCDKVNLSKYAEIGGFPVSGLGLAFYAVLAVFALAALASPQRLARHFTGVIFVAGALGFLFDLYLGFILAFELKVFCVLCLATYAINLAVVFLVWFAPAELRPGGIKGALREAAVFLRPAGLAAELPGSLAAIFSSWLAAMIAAGAAVLATFFWQYQSLAADKISQNELHEKMRAWFAQQPTVSGDLEIKQSPRHGPDDAKVVFVEFSDYQCPYCKKAAQYLNMVFEEYRDRIQIVFKNYPLDRACNPKIKHEMHAKACLFARAGFCAEQSGRFWPMHDRLFAEGEGINYSNIGQHAAAVGLEEKGFLACLESDAAKKAIERDLALGDRIGVTSTPTLIVNGRRLPGLLEPRVLKSLIDSELNARR